MKTPFINLFIILLGSVTVELINLKFNDDNEHNLRPNFEEYRNLRYAFFAEEKQRATGSEMDLNENEKLANDIIMKAKYLELNQGYENPYNFTPARHIFDVLTEVQNSNLFRLIQRMPKGGMLHGHDTSICSLDYVMSLTYVPSLWQCQVVETNYYHFKFSINSPDSITGCQWILVADERFRMGVQEYDNEIRKLFTLFTENATTYYNSSYHIWTKFRNIFRTLEPIVTYLPVWKDYFKQGLKEFHADGVLYLELRSTLPILYDLTEKIYTHQDTVQVYVDAVNEFNAEHPDFIGSKLIYAPNRKVNDSKFETYMELIVKLKNRFPNFIAGFDLVSHEDSGRPLIDYAQKLLELPNNISFLFHAGETNWNGHSTDENLVDAILLGTKRIGHAYAILKHPKVLEIVKQRRIAIEVSPISNQVLKLSNDNRNHPGAFLFADNYPIVIGSDDPSFWETTPLSHDFYITFLGITAAHSDLRTLKQLAMNSITYSSLDSIEKENAFQKWQIKWDKYIEWIIEQNGNQSIEPYGNENI